MNHTTSILRDYNPDQGYTAWLFVTFTRPMTIGQVTYRSVRDIASSLLNKHVTTVKPAVTDTVKGTKFWLAGPITEDEVSLIEQRKHNDDENS